MLDYDFDVKANYKSVPDTSTLRRENYKRFGGTTGKYHINTRTLSFHWCIEILDGSCQANTHTLTWPVWIAGKSAFLQRLACLNQKQHSSTKSFTVCIARERKKQTNKKNPPLLDPRRTTFHSFITAKHILSVSPKNGTGSVPLSLSLSLERRSAWLNLRHADFPLLDSHSHYIHISE